MPHPSAPVLSRIPAHTIESAPASTRPILAALAQRSFGDGRLLNLHAEMAHAPVVLAAYMGVRKALEEQSTLDDRTRFAIALSVSSVHGSAYGQTLNAVLARRSGWTAEQISAISAGRDPGDAKIAALLAVARQAAANVGDVDDATWQAALDAGWTDGELAESFATISVAQLVDSFVNFAQTELDVPPTLPPR